MARKMVVLKRNSREFELWERAESKARQELGSGAREGEVLAYICHEFLDEKGPVFPDVQDKTPKCENA